MGNVIENWCEVNKDNPDCLDEIQSFKRNEGYFDKKLKDAAEPFERGLAAAIPLRVKLHAEALQ